MKTIVRQNKRALPNEYQHFFCPYCGKYLNPKDVEKLQCPKCKEYLVGDANGELKFSEDKQK